MKFVYLIQGAIAMLRRLPLPKDAIVYALCYDAEGTIESAKHTIFDPDCSWAAGRNRLLELACKAHPDADYYVFCDDDVSFARGSAAEFEALIRQHRPRVAVPLTHKALDMHAVAESPIQKAIVIDELLVALHRSAIPIRGIAPLVTEFDAISWHIACQIFEYEVMTRFEGQCHQYNSVLVNNDQHTWQQPDTKYKLAARKTVNAVTANYYRQRGAPFRRSILFTFRGPLRSTMRKLAMRWRLRTVTATEPMTLADGP